MDILKKPMDTAEFFTKICDILNDKGIMPGILDYAIPAHNPVLITTSGFSFRNNLDYGSNEGIYLDIWITFDKGGRNVQKGLGTFKTLLEDGTAMETMGKLLAGFITVTVTRLVLVIPVKIWTVLYTGRTGFLKNTLGWQ